MKFCKIEQNFAKHVNLVDLICHFAKHVNLVDLKEKKKETENEAWPEL